MVRITPFLLLVLALAATPVAHAAEPPADAAPAERKAVAATRNAKADAGAEADADDPFAAVAALLRAKDYPGALARLRPVIDDEAFAERPAAERRRLRHGTAQVAAFAGDLDYAAAQFRAAIADGSTNPDDWFLLTLVESDRRDYEAAAQAMAATARRWPDGMDRFTSIQVLFVFSNARKGGPAERALAEALFESGWDLPQFGGANEVWHRLALRRLADGDREGAAAALARLAAPRQLVQVRVDRRFDDLVDRDGPTLDIARAAARHANELRLQVLLAPERLDVLLSQLQALVSAGEFEEALAISDDALARIAAADPGAPPFEDMDYVGALGNLRANVLLHLGRTDEATAQLLASSESREFGVDNVSQVLNLSLHYSQRGQVDKAREALARVGDSLSPFGRMIQAYARLRIAIADGDDAAREAALEYLEGTQALEPTLYLQALLVAGDVDQAARRLVGQLADETARSEALYFLQGLRSPPVLPGDVAFRANREALLARADVRAAVQRVGRIAADLKVEIAHQGVEPDQDGTWLGSIRKGYADLKASLKKDSDAAYIASLEEQEDRVLEAFRDALDAGQPLAVRTLAARHLPEVQQMHDQMRALKKAKAA